VDRGLTLYSSYCAVCHQANGEGVPGQFPPLKGSSAVNRADATKHIDVVLNGLQGARVSGVTYTSPMPAFAATLNDAEITAIVDYERGAWGNHGLLISAAQVASERARLNN
jgi:mono/diheme cytochrome c family protein